MSEKRFTIAQSPLAESIARAVAETGGWSVSTMREHGFRMLESMMDDGGFRAAAGPLPDKAQVMLDAVPVKVGLQRLTFVADLLAENLVYPISDPLSVTQLEWNTISRMGGAQRVMNPSSRIEGGLPVVLPNRLPIYLTMDGFRLDIRTLKTAQRVGFPLDTSEAEDRVRSVNESIEDAAINGATTLDGQALQDAGYTAPGLTNAPNANTQANSVDWTAVNVIGTTGPAMFADVQGAISKLQADKKYGPYNLYVGTVASNVMDGDFKVNTTGTIRQRIEQIQAGGRNVRVRTADYIPGAATGVQAVLVQMTSDVVDVVVGQTPTIIPWTSLDGFTINNTVMAVMVPRVRSDYEGNSGICLLSKS